MSGQFQVPAALVQERTPVPIDYEVCRTPESVWTFWKREKYVAPTGIRTQDRPTRSLVTISTTLSHLAVVRRNTYARFRNS